MNFDLQRILESKAAHRRKLADLPIGEKLRLLDDMRERSLTILRAAERKGHSVVNEDSASYGSGKVKPLDDPDFIGAGAALKRAAAKALARAKAAGLEPVTRKPEDHKKEP